MIVAAVYDRRRQTKHGGHRQPLQKNEKKLSAVIDSRYKGSIS
jgi:hypothetical protein